MINPSVFRRGFSLSLLVALILFAGPACAEWMRLSQGQEFSSMSLNHTRPAISPDGLWVVYWQDAETDLAYELWSVRLPAGTPVRISGILPADGYNYDFAISPDSARVIYLAEQDTDNVAELYSVPISGPASAGVKLNGALVAGGKVMWFLISPDSSRVVYWANQETAAIWELYSVPISGPASAGVKLNGTFVAGGGVSKSFAISPDSSRVVYKANQQTAAVLELYSVPISGPASAGVKLNGALVANGEVLNWAISPDSSRVVYRADQQTDEVWELYSVPLAGPAVAGVKLNGGLVEGGDVNTSFKISPDSSHVVYWADQDTNDVSELYSVPLAGPAVAGVKLNASLVAGGGVGEFAISPYSSRVVYRADQETDGVFELYSVPLDGPSEEVIKISGPMVSGGNVESFMISPDDVWAVYIADQELDEYRTGHRAKIDGSYGPDGVISASSGLVYPVTYQYLIAPDSTFVAERANWILVDSIVRIWTYPLAGTPDVQGTDWLGGELQQDGDCIYFQLLPDSSGAIYIADQEVDEEYALYLLYFRLWGDGFETGDTDRWSVTVN